MKKGISPVVATALLVVIAVVAVVGFNTWFNQYQSKILSGVEQQASGSGIPIVDSLIGNSLYIKNPSKTSLNVSLVKINGKTCISGAVNANKGLTEVNVTSCMTNLTKGLIYDAVIVTNQGVYSKKFYIKTISGTSVATINHNLTPVIIAGLSCGTVGSFSGLTTTGEDCCGSHNFPIIGMHYGRYGEQSGSPGTILSQNVTITITQADLGGPCGGINPILFPISGFIYVFLNGVIKQSISIPTTVGVYSYSVIADGVNNITSIS